MVDMTALERQIADESLRIVGPEPVVDDAAIFAAITATQSPTWRFGSLFSATKFVVAGVIVALFGGFLLAGALTPPSDEPLPPAAASASSSSDASIVPDRSVNPDLLPGVDLVTEEVEPGVYRVVDDGLRDLSGIGLGRQRGHTFSPAGLAVGPDGDVFLHTAPAAGSRSEPELIRLGDPGSLPMPGSWMVFSDEDSVVTLGSRGSAVDLRRVDHSGRVWVRDGPSGGVRVGGQQYLDGQPVDDMEVTPDGNVWVLSDDLYVITPDSVAGTE